MLLKQINFVSMNYLWFSFKKIIFLGHINVCNIICHEVDEEHLKYTQEHLLNTFSCRRQCQMNSTNVMIFEVFTFPSITCITGATYDYDLALLKVKNINGAGITFTDHVQPACLPESDTEYTIGQSCHISGWGKTELGNVFSEMKIYLIKDI